MKCPNCAASLTAENLPVDGRIGTCQQCGRSLVLMDADEIAVRQGLIDRIAIEAGLQKGEIAEATPLRCATSADLEHLSDSQIRTLRASRPSHWRQSALATKARLRG